MARMAKTTLIEMSFDRQKEVDVSSPISQAIR